MDHPLSDSDIERKLGNCVMMYQELEDYETIEDVLPEIGSYKVLLVRRTPNSGHWVTIFRHALNEYYFVNPYGFAYDKQEMSLVSRDKRSAEFTGRRVVSTVSRQESRQQYGQVSVTHKRSMWPLCYFVHLSV